MNGKAICEAMIYTYAELENLCDICDGKIYKKAVHSIGQDAHKVYAVIRKYINEKIAYCNTKVIIDEALKGLKRSHELKAFLAGEKEQEIARRYGIETSTAVVRIQSQIWQLTQQILKTYSTGKLLDVICDSHVLMSRYVQRIGAKK